VILLSVPLASTTRYRELLEQHRVAHVHVERNPPQARRRSVVIVPASEDDSDGSVDIFDDYDVEASEDDDDQFEGMHASTSRILASHCASMRRHMALKAEFAKNVKNPGNSGAEKKNIDEGVTFKCEPMFPFCKKMEIQIVNQLDMANSKNVPTNAFEDCDGEVVIPYI